MTCPFRSVNGKVAARAEEYHGADSAVEGENADRRGRLLTLASELR